MWLNRALNVFESIDDKMGMANCLHGLGIIARTRGDDSESLALYGRAEKIFDSIGYQHGVVNCLNSVAEVSRHRGELDLARQGYESTLKRAEAIGSHAGMLVRLNLSLVFNRSGSFSRSEPLLQRARAELLSLGRKGLLAAVEVLLLPCLAHNSDWRAWDLHFRSALGLLNETGMFEDDVAESAFIAGRLAMEKGKVRRARDAFNLARSQWSALKKESRIADVDAYMARL